jgi:hypothetical protein
LKKIEKNSKYNWWCWRQRRPRNQVGPQVTTPRIWLVVKDGDFCCYQAAAWNVSPNY